MKGLNKRKKYFVPGILVSLIFIIAGILFFMIQTGDQSKNEQSEEKREEVYLSFNSSDKEMTDLYAEIYEMPKENVAEIQQKTTDWDKTAEELEKEFFTISENKKLQMEKEGYSLEDLQEAERLSARTGRKAIELAKAKGKVSDNRKWTDIVKDSEVLTTEEQLGLTKDQVQQLKDRLLEKEERVEVAVLLLNETYTFEEVVKELDTGKTVRELAGK